MPQPFGYRVAVKDPPGDDERTDSGLIIKAGRKIRRGIVSAVGQNDPMANLPELFAGDTIWFPEGHDIEIPHVDGRGTDTTRYVDLACIIAYQSGAET